MPKRIIPSNLVVGRLLRAIRRSEGLMQEKLAEETKLNISAIAWVETGRSALSFSQERKVETALLEVAAIPFRGAIQQAAHRLIRLLESQGYAVSDKGGSATAMDRDTLDRLAREVWELWNDDHPVS